jgi:hypothetical protein
MQIFTVASRAEYKAPVGQIHTAGCSLSIRALDGTSLQKDAVLFISSYGHFRSQMRLITEYLQLYKRYIRPVFRAMYVR